MSFRENPVCLTVPLEGGFDIVSKSLNLVTQGVSCSQPRRVGRSVPVTCLVSTTLGLCESCTDFRCFENLARRESCAEKIGYLLIRFEMVEE